MFKKIGIKLIFATSVATIIIITVFAYINIQYQSEMMIDEIKRHSSQCSETIKNSTRFEMVHNKRAHIYSILRAISNQEGVCRLRIINKDGFVVYAMDSSMVGSRIDKKNDACIACHFSKTATENITMEKRIRTFQVHPDSSRKMGIINPIFNEPSCYEAACHVHAADQNVLGILDVTVSLDEIDAKIENAKIHLLWYALISIIALSGVIWFFVKRWVDQPVTELVAATNHVAAGNFNYTIKDSAKDQLGTLAHSFNNMTNKLLEARQQIYRSDKLASLGRLAAGVAHEINNPLTGILTYASFLQKRTAEQPEVQEDLSIIVRETKRSREIVKGLLDFSRQSTPKKRKDDVNKIIKRAVKVIDNQLMLSQVKINFMLDEDLEPITIDSNQMQQVFINLIDNAAHAMSSEGGMVTVSSALVQLSPHGLSSVRNALCPKGHSLMDHDIKVEGLSSVKVAAKVNGKSGYINLDPIYGKNRNQYGLKFDNKASVKISCTKCSTSLIRAEKTCPKCMAPLYFFETPGRGQFEGCARIGCDFQYWEIIEMEGKKDYVQIKIEDTGTGIDGEHLSKIFEPFFSTKGQKGTGLGLAVVWGIIDKHDGRISVHSEEGKGTLFKIFLPFD